MEIGIDYPKIAQAIEFYDSKGFRYIEVPWIVSEESDSATAPKEVRRFRCFLDNNYTGNHIASGEQGFLELILEGRLSNGKYCCATPCYRDEKVVDEIHKRSFFKVELIDYLGKAEKFESYNKEKQLIETSNEFFSKYLQTEIIGTLSGRDIISKNEKIELGSYGHRSYKTYHWIYGTGIAEPRLSYVLSLKQKGYHKKDIPHEEFGSAEKIYEELLEFKDSLNQGIKIMSLLELSDIIGAIEGYTEKNFPEMSLDDLLEMKEATRRSFGSGKRR
jgi:hypothetical protein